MGFTHYKPYTVASGKVPSTQTNFVVVLPIAADNDLRTIANGGHVANASGFDLRPYADAALTTPLSYELVGYTATTGVKEMYVLVPSLDDGVVVYLAYGDAALSSDGSAPSTVWADYVGVWHGEGLNDSSPSGYTLTNVQVGGASAVFFNNATTPPLGGACARFTHTNNSVYNYLKRDSADALAAVALTVECWFRSAALPNTYNYVFAYTNVGSTELLEARPKNSNKLACGSGPSGYDGTGALSFTSAVWTHLLQEYSNATGLNVYLDNALDKNVAAGGDLPTTTGKRFAIGGDRIDILFRTWHGDIDEVRVRTSVPTANNRTTNYNNQSAPGTFWTTGSEVAAPSDGGVNPGSIFNSRIFNSPIFNSRVFG